MTGQPHKPELGGRARGPAVSRSTGKPSLRRAVMKVVRPTQRQQQVNVQKADFHPLSVDGRSPLSPVRHPHEQETSER